MPISSPEPLSIGTDLLDASTKERVGTVLATHAELGLGLALLRLSHVIGDGEINEGVVPVLPSWWPDLSMNTGKPGATTTA